MQNTINISVDAIKVHPRNTEFFDDIGGTAYETFRDSIKEDGIVTPLIVAGDMTLLSGHQRLKAAQDIGLASVPVVVRDDMVDEDEKLKILLVANFGRDKNDEAKQRKIAVEYVRLRGNPKGTNQHSRKADNRLSTLTQEQIAKELGISTSTLKEMLDIERKLTPDFKEMLGGGVFTKTTASKILVKLSKDEQSELLETFGSEIIEGVTQKQMQKYADQIKGLEKSNADLKAEVEALTLADDLSEEIIAVKRKERKAFERAEGYKRQVEELKKKKPEVKAPDDYEKLKCEAANYDENIRRLLDQLQEKESKLLEYQKNEEHAKFIGENQKEPPVGFVTDYDSELFINACVAFKTRINPFIFAGAHYEDMSDEDKRMCWEHIEQVRGNVNRIIELLGGAQ